MIPELKISVHTNPVGGVGIWIYERRPGNEIALAKPVELVFEPHDMFDIDPRPTFSMADCMAREFMTAMAEMLDQQGVKTDSDATLRGTLAAQGRHLNDLRHLLKLPKMEQSK